MNNLSKNNDSDERKSCTNNSSKGGENYKKDSTSKNKEKRKFDLTATMYSFITGSLFILGGVLEKRIRKRVYTEIIPLQGDEKILDLCCANGKGTRIIASLLKKGEVFGIDLNPKMIDIAYAKSKKYPNVKFKVGDCTRIPFPDHSFDVVTATLAFHEIPTYFLKTVLKEIKRVLNKKGYLFVFDFRLPENPKAFLRFFYYGLRIFEDESAARFMMVDQEKLLARNGFKSILQKNYLGEFMPATLYQSI